MSEIGKEEQELLDAFETHSIAEIGAALAGGVDAQRPINGKSPLEWLVLMYTRSPRFADCVQQLMNAGATLEDELLHAMLLDDPDRLAAALDAQPSRLADELHVASAYTSLEGVSPLHVCAEYNSVRCARALIERGLDVNTPARVDAHGFGGHTALFHTVNSNGNHCRPAMELLLEAGAALDVRVPALLWGAHLPWETAVFDVTPIAYAQCGLYPQFHRPEEQVYANIDLLYRKLHGTPAPVRNCPNRYVADSC